MCVVSAVAFRSIYSAYFVFVFFLTKKYSIKTNKTNLPGNNTTIELNARCVDLFFRVDIRVYGSTRFYYTMVLLVFFFILF